MEKRGFLKSLCAGLAVASLPVFPNSRTIGEASSQTDACALMAGEIQHMVIFSLKHARDSNETTAFLRDGQRILGAIPGVRGFQVLSQVSKKNNFDFGFSMKFSSAADYEKYNRHPEHAGFVEKRWKTEVSRFLEIDCEPFRLSQRS